MIPRRPRNLITIARCSISHTILPGALIRPRIMKAERMNTGRLFHTIRRTGIPRIIPPTRLPTGMHPSPKRAPLEKFLITFLSSTPNPRGMEKVSAPPNIPEVIIPSISPTAGSSARDWESA